MSRSFSSSVSAFALSVMVLTMAGCQSAPSSSSAPATPSELEGRVAALEGQMKAAQPTLKKVEVMETHFRALSSELDKIAASYETPVVAAPVAAEPVADVQKEAVVEKPAVLKKETPKVKEKKAAVVSDKLSVTSVRIGDQPKDITRIVLDTTKSAEIHYDLDNGENLLVIDIPKSEWATTESMDFKKSPMVKSFHASHDETGAHLVINLKQTAKVVATARLKPSGDSGNRVYVDIAPASGK